MRKPKNPFHTKNYLGPNYFCDREEETQKLISNAENGINTTLISIRRMGKTGLLLHTFNQIDKKSNGIKCIYVDIYASQNLTDLTNVLASCVLKAFPKTLGTKFIEAIKRFSPTISYDPLSGTPEISFSLNQPQENERSLTGIFNFLNQQKSQIIVAFDEFQQVAKYPENNTEAILRSIVQNLNNVNFIFSGSHEHILTDIFTQTNRPFFSSTQVFKLKAIPEKKYALFIQKQFDKYKRTITPEAIDFILSWTRRHTYYTQSLCNKLFSLDQKNTEEEAVKKAAIDILKEQEPVFYQYRNLLTKAQWSLLKAIAIEKKLFHPTAQDFIKKHDLGSGPTVKRSLDALLEKEMVFRSRESDQNYYQVYDCFLSRWLEQN